MLPEAPMTVEVVECLKGEALNIAVGQRVFGWRYDAATRRFYPPDTPGGWIEFPKFSEDIEQAWMIVERFTSTTKQQFRMLRDNNTTTVRLEISGAGEQDFEVSYTGLTACEAICRAGIVFADQMRARGIREHA